MGWEVYSHRGGREGSAQTVEGTQRSKGNTHVQKKVGTLRSQVGDKHWLREDRLPRTPKVKARASQLALNMLILSRWKLCWTKRTRLPVNSQLQCKQSAVGRTGPWGSQEGELKGPRWPLHVSAR